jgi:glycosyltransferase involved in cell wall biosynthesis
MGVADVCEQDHGSGDCRSGEAIEMNVVLLSDTASVNGGAAKVALDGARALAKAGHQVSLICGVGPIAPELRNQPNLTVHCVGHFDIVDDPNRLRAIAKGWWNPQSRKDVGEVLDSLDRQNTIVHVHSWTKALSSSAVRAAVDRGFEIVFTIHDFLLACPTGTFFLQDTLEKCTLRPLSAACLCRDCDVRSYQHKLWRVGRRVVQDQFGYIPSGIKNFIYSSQLAIDLLRPYLPKDANFHSVPNAIEVDRNEPAKVADSETFVYLGRLEQEKGSVLFARAAAAEGARCRFIGEGSAREAVARANPQAILSGWMNHRDGVNALREARALVFPSLWYETLGLVVLEAAGNGVPSIVPDTSAARESVVDGVTGLYFRSGDQADLQAKMAILRDPEVAARMGQAAYKKFWAPPGWGMELHRERLENTYAQILGAKYPVAEPMNVR